MSRIFRTICAWIVSLFRPARAIALSWLMIASAFAADTTRVGIAFYGFPQSTPATVAPLAKIINEVGGNVELVTMPSVFDLNGGYANLASLADSVKMTSGLDLRFTPALALHQIGGLDWNVFLPNRGTAAQRQTAIHNSDLNEQLSELVHFIRTAELVRVSGVANFRYGYVVVMEQESVGVDLKSAYPNLIAAINSNLQQAGVSASYRTCGTSGVDVRVSGAPLELHSTAVPSELTSGDYFSDDGFVSYDSHQNTMMQLDASGFANAVRGGWNSGRKVAPVVWHYEFNGTYSYAQKQKTAHLRGTLSPFTHDPNLGTYIKTALCESRAAMNSSCAKP